MLTGSFPGVWWQPENPDKRIAGVLSLDYEGLGVDLIGSFGRLEDMGRVTSYPVLHGTTTGGLFVTLMNAVITNESLIMSALGLRSTRLQPGAALIGGLIDDPHGGAWPNCSVELERMTAWASPPGFEHSLESRDGSHLKGASFRYDVPPSVELRIPGATLSIGPSQTISGDLIHEAKMAVTVDANFRLDRPATIEEIYQRFLKPLLNLVVLATQKPTSIITISLAAGDEAPRKWVEVVSRRPSPASEQRKRLLPMDALFLLPDLLEASADGVGLWYAAAEKVERAFDLVSAVRSTTSLFLDHRFLNAVTAAESYHEARFDRRTMSKEAWDKIVDAAAGAAPDELTEQIRNRIATLNKPSLRDRVQEIVNRGGEPLRGLLPDPDGLGLRASRLRNDLAHGGSIDARNDEIFDTTDELLLVLEFHFLREAGFSADQASDRLKAASGSYSGLWLRRRQEANSAVEPTETPD
jgi:hypothetical protein